MTIFSSPSSKVRTWPFASSELFPHHLRRWGHDDFLDLDAERWGKRDFLDMAHFLDMTQYFARRFSFRNHVAQWFIFFWCESYFASFSPFFGANHVAQWFIFWCKFPLFWSKSCCSNPPFYGANRISPIWYLIEHYLWPNRGFCRHGNVVVDLVLWGNF